MKKIILILTLLVVLVFTGCSARPNNTSTSGKQESRTKACKLEVISAQDDTLLKTIDDQETVHKFLQVDEWKEVEELPQDLVPEFKLIIHQEKTLLAGQDPNMEREYEIIVRITTFKDSCYVEESISSGISIKIDEFLTYYYELPDDINNELRQVLQ